MSALPFRDAGGGGGGGGDRAVGMWLRHPYVGVSHPILTLQNMCVA